MTSTKAQEPSRPGTIVPASSPTTMVHQTEVPEYLRGSAGVGLEEMAKEDMVIPRIAIAQALSPALRKNKPQYIEGLTTGKMYNTVTKEIYGESVLVVPIVFNKARIWFEDINEGGGILCQSANSINGGVHCPAGCVQCENSRFIDGNPPACNLFMNYPGLVLKVVEGGYEVLGIASVSMKSTALSVAKKWNAMLRLSGVATYGKVYKVKVVDDSRGQNDFFNFDVMPHGFTPEAIFRQAAQFHETMKAQGVRVDLNDIMDQGTDFDESGFGPDEGGQVVEAQPRDLGEPGPEGESIEADPIKENGNPIDENQDADPIEAAQAASSTVRGATGTTVTSRPAVGTKPGQEARPKPVNY